MLPPVKRIFGNVVFRNQWHRLSPCNEFSYISIKVKYFSDGFEYQLTIAGLQISYIDR
jgi:hypothetical protein